MGTASTQLKPTGKQRKQDREKSDVKQTLSLSSSVTKVREYKVPGVKYVFYISIGKSGRFWVSDDDGNLVQTDLQGNQLQKIQTSGRSVGYHTVIQCGDLIYTDQDNKVINRITPDKTITEFIKTGDFAPLSIHSSHINGDILVGMINDGEPSKVTRYNKTGIEIQNIQRDYKGQGLYSYPHYITENINGDVCVSDRYSGVVVVDTSGQHRFSYTGQRSGLRPRGICTDVLGHIMVCDAISRTVHLLDQGGQFLSLLLTEQQGVVNIFPRSVCVWMMNNICGLENLTT
ncbi:tripartite motif-containing protein 2-like [Magallana gigas]|uniref:tripartite motif-containing protein 2-like n=1 Tax=Magallana gigas TaxID=29159 RepID=UPI00333F9DF0